MLNRKPAARVVKDFLTWRAGVRGHPYFAFLNLYDAHEPYLPPEPFERRFVREPPRTAFFYDTDRVERLETLNVSVEETRAQMDRYDGAIASIDMALGHLFDTLDREALDNTIVIITSDHGEEFMEHGRLGHVQDMFMSLIQVPLVLVAPGRVPGDLRVPAAVSIADLPATILELAELPRPSLMPGESLARFWIGDETVSDRPVLAEANPGRNYKSVLHGRYHYIRERGGPRFFYDVVADPREQRNLVGMPDMQSELRRLDAVLDSLLTETASPPYGSGSLSKRAPLGAENDSRHP
jgi:arylsulfatase A-like enzyme